MLTFFFWLIVVALVGTFAYVSYQRGSLTAGVAAFAAAGGAIWIDLQHIVEAIRGLFL